MTQVNLKDMIDSLYQSRKARKTFPDGFFDDNGYWWPSIREDHGAKKIVVAPTEAWPHTYLLHCRSKKHCKVLVEAALADKDVPTDVLDVLTKPQASAVRPSATPKKPKVTVVDTTALTALTLAQILPGMIADAIKKFEVEHGRPV